MHDVGNILSHEVTCWIRKKAVSLPEKARYRAYNSFRFLEWAREISANNLPIPAAFCALHATEEAVAAFVSCAKDCGYGKDSHVNIHDHKEKAIVSLVVERISDILLDYNIGIALDGGSDRLTIRYEVDGALKYDISSVKIFTFVDGAGLPIDNFQDAVLSAFEDISALRRDVIRRQDARNKIFYASDRGFPVGFLQPDVAIFRECQVSLALIWASIDLHDNRGEVIPIFAQAFRTIRAVAESVRGGKCC